MPINDRRAVMLSLLGLALAAGLSAATIVPAAAKTDLAAMFARSTEGSAATVDHAAWSQLLATYVKPGGDGLNRVDYKAFKAEGRAALEAYLVRLQAVDVAALARPEQFAFWANLYNAETIAIVLDHYPVASIKKISLGGTLLSNLTGGPWKAKVVKVAGEELSLDDIEHAILRPIFKDPRAHYAVNCASIGCPNLGTAALTGATLGAQLDAAAKAYINSPRGARVEGDTLIASGIYEWFAVDFGGETGVLAHLKRYSEPALRSKLEGFDAIDDYAYDWSLNDAAR